MTNIETYLKQLETEMTIRGFSKRTMDTYLGYNKRFLDYIKKSPNKIKIDDIKMYMNYLISERAVSTSAVNVILASLEFYYNEVLKRNMPHINRPKRLQKLPTVLSCEEVQNIIDKTKNQKHRLIIELLYSSGLRVSELVNLKFSDIDIKEGVGWVRNGKGGKDRMFIISKELCKDLEGFALQDGQNEAGWLFSGGKRSLLYGSR